MVVCNDRIFLFFIFLVKEKEGALDRARDTAIYQTDRVSSRMKFTMNGWRDGKKEDLNWPTGLYHYYYYYYYYYYFGLGFLFGGGCICCNLVELVLRSCW